MGLLDRAKRFLRGEGEAADHPPETGSSSTATLAKPEGEGLLHRASRLRDQYEREVAGREGLLKKAERLRAENGKARRGARAAATEEPRGKAVSIAEIPEEETPRLKPVAAPFDERPAIKAETEDESIWIDNELSFEDEEGAAPRSEAETGSFTETDLPEFPYEESSADAFDFAKHEEELDEEIHDDPFQNWIAEAERDAEREAKQLEKPRTGLTRESPFIFEDDSEVSTMPSGNDPVLQKKIDQYMNLFDITREIAEVQDFEELWDSILYAIMGEIGVENLCIFSTYEMKPENAVYYPVAASGFDVNDDWVLKPGNLIYDDLHREPEIKYADYFRHHKITKMEAEILDRVQAVHLVPIRDSEGVYGIIVIGPSLSGESFTLSDFEFLDRLIDISTAGLNRIRSGRKMHSEFEEMKVRSRLYSRVFEIAQKASHARNMDELYDLLAKHLEEDFAVTSFSFVLLAPEENKYRIFAGNRISAASVEKFALPVSSALVGTVSNLTRVYELQNFKKNRDLIKNYTGDDLAVMSHYWIVPLVNLKWLVGFISIHDTSEPWTDLQREFIVLLSEIFSPLIANSVMVHERETLFRDPFRPVEERLRDAVKQALAYDSSVSLLVLRVKNLNRLVALNPPERITEFLTLCSRIISSSLYESDFLYRIGKGRFAVILGGKNRDQAEVFARKVMSAIRQDKLLASSPVGIQFAEEILSVPDDTNDTDRLLALLD